jgi:demethylmenaquinone methyltransferase/2-methoxy-6-polyprenyl-1,4-benzoquinol methylase
MSTYVLMRILESAPHRYERGMRLLTFGAIDRAYDALAGLVEPGQRVIDIGCGTGSLTRRVAARGAVVKGIDVNPEMLAIARGRIADEGMDTTVELVEAGVAELDVEPDDAYDAVVTGLCFSELSGDELRFTLAQVARMLRPGGQLLVADEVRPRRSVFRVINAFVRLPLACVTYVLTQQTTRAVRDLPVAIEEAGLRLVSETRSALGTFGVFVAAKPMVGVR